MKLLLASAFILLLAGPCYAEYIDSTGPCPLSCSSQGYGKKACKDSKQGNSCKISVKKKAIGKGKGTFSKACPLSCSEVGAKGKCKDWKEGNTCFVKVG